MSWNPFNWTGEPFLALYLNIAFVIFSLGFWLRLRIGPGEPTPAKLSPLELAYLAGGARRLGDAALFSLMSAKAASVNSTDYGITVTNRAELNALLGQATRAPVHPNMTRQQFQAVVDPLIKRVRGRLQQLGYCPTDKQMASFHMTVLPFVAALVGFGMVKAWVGAERHHPIGFLVILLIVTVLAGVAVAMRPKRTQAGSDALKSYLTSHERAMRAPLGHELLLALALSGTIVLAGTPYASVHAASRPSNSDGGGGCSGGDGGDGGGGCGGCS